MAVSIDEAIERFSELINRGNDIILESLMVASLDAYANVDQRITETGKDSKGQPFKPYSKQYQKFKEGGIQEFTYKKENQFDDFDQAFTIKKTRIQLKKKIKRPNRDVGHVNFRYSGDMLNSMGLKEKINGEGKSTVVIGARDEGVNKKLEGNNKHRPGFLNLSDPEREIVREDFETRVLNEFKTILE